MSDLAWTHTSSNSVTRNYCCRAREVTLSFMDTLIALTYLLTYSWRVSALLAATSVSVTLTSNCTAHWSLQIIKRLRFYLDRLAVDNPCTKFKISSITGSRDRNGSQMFKKAVTWSNLVRLILAMIHMCTIFELSSFSLSVDRRGSQIFNAGHVTRATPPVGNYIFSVSTCHDLCTHQIWSV